MAEQAVSHTLTGFSDAATAFVSALEGNRRRIAARAGLSATELRALFHVAQVVSITPKDLAAYLGMTTGAVTAISRRLVETDHLQRIDHPADRRSLYLELSPHGDQVMTEIHRDFKAMLADSTGSLTAPELETFSKALRAVSGEVRARLSSD